MPQFYTCMPACLSYPNTNNIVALLLTFTEVDCPYLPLESRDDLNYSTNSTKAGTRIVFDCKNNNVLVGNKEIHCQASGSWSGTLPRCEGMNSIHK